MEASWPTRERTGGRDKEGWGRERDRERETDRERQRQREWEQVKRNRQREIKDIKHYIRKQEITLKTEERQ